MEHVFMTTIDNNVLILLHFFLILLETEYLRVSTARGGQSSVNERKLLKITEPTVNER